MRQDDTAPSRHTQLIEARQQCDPIWQRRGFRRAGSALVKQINDARPARNRMPDLVETLIDLMGFVPDLYYVTEDPPTIAICEVECSHRVPQHKRHDIGTLGDMLVELGIDLRVLIVDAYGSETEIRWEDWHLEMIYCWAREPVADVDSRDSESKVLPRPARAAPLPRVRQPKKRTRTLDEIIDAAIARRQRAKKQPAMPHR